MELAASLPAVAAAVSGSARSAVATPRETAESLDDDFYASSMSVLCPLNDEYLPMDASNLKSKQVGRWLVWSACRLGGWLPPACTAAAAGLWHTCRRSCCMSCSSVCLTRPGCIPARWMKPAVVLGRCLAPLHSTSCFLTPPHCAPPPRTHTQVEVALAQLKDLTRDDSVHQMSLEALARLAWSDDDVRQAVADNNGVKYITQVRQGSCTWP